MTIMHTLKALLFVVTMAGCAGSGQVRYSATAEVTTPVLVEVEPGVQVVENYDEPVFFNDGYYWRYNAGVWYRSPYHNRAWIRVEAPPVAVRRIERPERFVHYRTNVHTDATVRGEDRRVRSDNREIHHDQGEIRHDQNELNHDRGEIQRDKERGDQRELNRDRKELQRDQREKAKDRKELDKDKRKERRDERHD